jgi:hypothetical protein
MAAARSISVAVALAGFGLLVVSRPADAETQQLSDSNGEAVSSATPETLPLAGSDAAKAAHRPDPPISGYDSLSAAPSAESDLQRVLNTIVQSGGAAARSQ